MSNTWNRWTHERPTLRPTDTLDLVYIDGFNRIINQTQPVSEIDWNGTERTLLAWRQITPAAKPTPTHLGTAYWNYITGKFWPRTFRRPPRHKLPYFRIEVSMYPDGTPKFDYFLLDPD